MILYLDQTYISSPKIHNLLLQHGLDIAHIEKAKQLWNPNIDSFYARAGTDTLFFSSSFKTLPGFGMPDYDSNFQKTWNTIMDQRCVDLYKKKYDRPWIVYWSGGIDSTGIMTSILQNIPPTDWSNIFVACNQFSIWENPRFFLNHIKPNFTVLNVKDSCPTEGNIYFINGEPADQLFAGGVSQKMIQLNGRHYLEKDATSESGLIIDYISGTAESPEQRPGRDFAEWLYNCLITNARSLSVPINTFHDLLWWSYFNFSWISAKLRQLQTLSWGNPKSIRPYLDKFIHWFDADDFQHWAMHNNRYQEKYGDSLGDYKKAAKKYIYDFDCDTYYFKYKTKTCSSTNVRYTKSWCGISSDFELIELDRDWSVIQEWLPQHINTFYRRKIA